MGQGNGKFRLQPGAANSPFSLQPGFEDEPDRRDDDQEKEEASDSRQGSHVGRSLGERLAKG